MVYYKRLILFVLLLFVFNNVKAQKYTFKNIGSDQGLSSIEIWDVIQDKEGFIWFTTLGGLVKYDGRLLKFYNVKNGLSSNLTRNLFEDSKGRIWCSTWKQGINIIVNDTVKCFSSDNGFNWKGASCFTEDDEGEIWIVGHHDIIKYSNGKFIDFDNVHDIKGISDVVYRNDTLWLSTVSNGVFAYDIKTKKYINYTIDNNLVNNICYSLFLDSDQKLWAGCYGGVSKITADTIMSYEISADADKNRVKQIIEDSEGYLWLALYGNGIAKWDKKSNRLVKLFSKKNGISYPNGNAILIDRDNNLWLGTDGDGLYYLNNQALQVYDIDYGFPTNKILSVNCKDDHLQILTEDAGEVLMYEDTIIRNEYKGALSSSIELNDTLWFGTSLGIWYRLNTTKSFNYFENSLANHNCFTCINSNGEFFFGGRDGYFKISNGHFNQYLGSVNNGNSTVTPVKFVLDKNGGVWSANMSSISFLKADSVYVYKPDSKFSNFYFDALSYDNKLFFIGGNKLERIEIIDSDTVYTHLETLNNLDIELAHCMSIIKDTVWIGHAKGVTFFKYSELEENVIKHSDFTIEDGFPSDGAHNMIFDENGICWVSSFDGLIKIDLRKKLKVIHEPTVYLTDVELFSEKSDTLSLSHLEYNQNHITIKWSSVGYNNPSNIEFSYKLKGFDTDWSKPESDLKTTYKKLPHGDFEFSIKARYKNSKWSKEFVLLNFKITPPFWESISFVLLIGLIILIFIISIIYNVVVSNRQKNILEQFSKELIQSQESERKKIANDLHDSVGQLLLFVKNKLQLSGNKDAELVNELDSALNEVREISKQLHPYQLEKFGLTKAIELLSNKAGESSDVFFSEDLENADGLLNKNQELAIYRVIQECVNNVIKHSKATASKIKLDKSKSQISLVIVDNGVGFKSKEILSGQTHSFGLTGVVERVKIIGGKINIDSTKEGTKIKINIPL
jgi:signal transduction histidine kinase/ligand-binding sensor domain-containing protein